MHSGWALGGRLRLGLRVEDKSGVQGLGQVWGQGQSGSGFGVGVGFWAYACTLHQSIHGLADDQAGRQQAKKAGQAGIVYILIYIF